MGQWKNRRRQTEKGRSRLAGRCGNDVWMSGNDVWMNNKEDTKNMVGTGWVVWKDA